MATGASPMAQPLPTAKARPSINTAPSATQPKLEAPSTVSPQPEATPFWVTLLSWTAVVVGSFLTPTWFAIRFFYGPYLDFDALGEGGATAVMTIVSFYLTMMNHPHIAYELFVPTVLCGVFNTIYMRWWGRAGRWAGLQMGPFFGKLWPASGIGIPA